MHCVTQIMCWVTHTLCHGNTMGCVAWWFGYTWVSWCRNVDPPNIEGFNLKKNWIFQFCLTHPTPKMAIIWENNIFFSKMIFNQFWAVFEKNYFFTLKKSKHFMPCICGWINMMLGVTNMMCVVTQTLCHGQHNALFLVVVWVDLGHLVWVGGFWSVSDYDVILF